MKPIHWLVIGLVAVIVLLLLFDRSPEPDTTIWKNRIVELEDEIKAVKASRTALLNEVKSDSAKYAHTQDSLSSRLNAKSAEVVRLKKNPIVIRVREEVPEVDSLIIAQDSVIITQGHSITAYEHQLNKLQVSMGAITANFESNLRLEQERYQAQKQITEVQEKENKKLKRKNKLLKVVAVAGTVGAFLLGSQL